MLIGKKRVKLKSKKISLIVILVLLLFLNLGFSSAVCTSSNTPRFKQDNYFELAEDELFEHDFELINMDDDGVSYTYALLDKKLTGVKINNKGLLTFTPSSDDLGKSQIAVIAVKESCADTLVVTFNIFDRPDIYAFEPKNSSFQINQTQSVIFMIRATDKDVNDTLMYEWLLDSEQVNDSINKTTFVFSPGFKLSGVHEVGIRVTDSYNLSETRTWYVQVSKVNRPPALLYPIPGFMVFKNTAAGAYNLNDYFYDPDGGLLRFEYKGVSPSFELSGMVYAKINVTISGNGFVTYNPVTNNTGRAYFVFTAYDILNKSAESNIVRVDVLGSEKFKTLEETSTKEFCGDYVCSVVEDCSTCPFDCGTCEQEQQIGCKPEWECTEWSACMPAGFMTRNCTDIYECNDNRSKPDGIRRCEYTARCDDGIKNGIETGVDCGGPCGPCPTCDDSMRNQGEEGIDCGGPCETPCPSCKDDIKNQNESDVDCGGPCPPCQGGKSCLKNKDCESLRCEYLICTFPSCNDSIRNQGEGGIDCGGPCETPCGNCSDGIQNQGEGGVDCGGPCRPCPRCDDGFKNGGESLVDCGGNCRKCGFNDYFQAHTIIFIIVFVILGLIPLGFIGYFFFLLANPERARGLYENNTGFTFLVEMNRFFRKYRKLRRKKPVISGEVIKGFIDELIEISKRARISNMELHNRIIRMYIVLLGLPEEYDDNIFNMKLMASSIPLFMKILFSGFYKKAEILSLATFVAPEQKADMIVELKFLLSELDKG